VSSLIGGLSLSQRGPERLVLALPAFHRAAFGLLAALSVFILCFGVLFEGEPTLLVSRNTVPGLLVVAMVFGLVYEDRWTFDRKAGRVENRFGTLFLARRTGFPIADLERIGLERFTRGSLAEGTGGPAVTPALPGGASLPDSLRPRRRWAQRIVRLVAVDRTGEVHVLDSAGAHRSAEFRSRGLRIAEFCGVRFEDATVGL